MSADDHTSNIVISQVASAIPTQTPGELQIHSAVNDFVRHDDVLIQEFDTIEETNQASRSHPYYELVREHNETSVLESFRLERMKELQTLFPPAEEDILPYSLGPLLDEYRQIVIAVDNYEKLIRGKTFIIPTITAGTGIANWEIYRHPSGKQYFIISRRRANAVRYRVQEVGMELFETTFKKTIWKRSDGTWTFPR